MAELINVNLLHFAAYLVKSLILPITTLYPPGQTLYFQTLHFCKLLLMLHDRASLGTRGRKAVSAIFRINKLTDSLGWLVLIDR